MTPWVLHGPTWKVYLFCFRILTKQLWIQDTGYRTLDTGYRIQDAGYRIQDTGYRIQDTGATDQNTFNL